MEYILEIDDVVSKEFCEDVISRFECDERKKIGETVSGVNEKIKKSLDFCCNFIYTPPKAKRRRKKCL